MPPSNSLAIELDGAVYGLSAVKKAGYKFADRCHVDIATQPDGLIRVTLTVKQPSDDAKFLAGEFRNEVLDQDLRETVAAETHAVRNVLMAQAFSKTALLDLDGEHGDPNADPLNIRRSDAAAGANGTAIQQPESGS